MTTIRPEPDASELWSGIAGHFDSLTQVLAEFVDNSAANFQGHNPPQKQVWIKVSEKGADRVAVSVEDTGTGIEDLEVAMRLGDISGGDSPLSEHGFGLKHALATANPENDAWSVCTREQDEFAAGHYRVLSAPFSFEMNVEDGETPSWPGQHHGPGTLVSFECSRQLFNSISKGTPGQPGYKRTVEYLVQDLGFIYADIIKKGQISISIMDGEQTYNVPAVEPTWRGWYPPRHGSVDKDLGKGPVTIEYEFGEMDESSWIRYYKRSMSTSGVEIRLNGRVIASNLFPEIWGLERHNAYNHLLVRLNLVSEVAGTLPKTRTSKNGFREGDSVLQELFGWVRTQMGDPPRVLTDHVSEADLRDTLRDKLLLLLPAEDKVVTTEHHVYANTQDPPSADLYVYDGTRVSIYEAKKDRANVQDLYQLLMYWDGLVNDGITPFEGVLIAAEFSAGLSEVIALFNEREDPAGNKYRLRTSTWRQMDVPYPPD